VRGGFYSAGFTQHPDLTLMGVLSALEMACWDIIGKEAGQPSTSSWAAGHERLRSYTYLYARAGDRSDSTWIPILPPSARAPVPGAGLYGAQFDPAGRTAPSTAGSCGSPTSNAASASWRQLREAVGIKRRIYYSVPWSDDGGRRDPARAAPGAGTSAVFGERRAPDAPKNGEGGRPRAFHCDRRRLTTKYDFGACSMPVRGNPADEPGASGGSSGKKIAAGGSAAVRFAPHLTAAPW